MNYIFKAQKLKKNFISCIPFCQGISIKIQRKAVKHINILTKPNKNIYFYMKPSRSTPTIHATNRTQSSEIGNNRIVKCNDENSNSQIKILL